MIVEEKQADKQFCPLAVGACRGAKCMMWKVQYVPGPGVHDQEVRTTKGYCGLAKHRDRVL